MKIIIVILVFCFFETCFTGSIPDSSPSVKNVDEVFASTHVGAFSLSLKSVKGYCALSYRVFGAGNEELEHTLNLAMTSPCEFIRDPDTLEPMFYTFKKGSKKVTVLIVTGGPPDAKERDKFLPLGCGTQQQRILVFESTIELGPPAQEFSTRCPSAGLDEVFFAGITTRLQEETSLLLRKRRVLPDY